MIGWFVGASLIALTIAASGVLLRRARLARVTRERLAETQPNEPEWGDEQDQLDEFFVRARLRRYVWVAVALGFFVGGVLLAIGLPWPFALSLGTLAGLLGWQIEETIAAVFRRRVEAQLADAVDMTVSAVKAGASLLAALDSATDNIARPLRDELADVVARIRYGDSPSDALRRLPTRVPLESVRLLTLTLTVNWEVGGRLAPTLANVGRTIRDRIEIARRLDAMTVQARLSVLAVVGVAYFLAAMMWRNDPERMIGFLSSTVGQALVAIAIALQGLGVVWIARLSRAKF